MRDDMQNLANMIAILTKRLGGQAEISFDEIDNPPIAVVTTDRLSNKIIIKVEE